MKFGRNRLSLPLVSPTAMSFPVKNGPAAHRGIVRRSCPSPLSDSGFCIVVMVGVAVAEPEPIRPRRLTMSAPRIVSLSLLFALLLVPSLAVAQTSCDQVAANIESAIVDAMSRAGQQGQPTLGQLGGVQGGSSGSDAGVAGVVPARLVGRLVAVAGVVAALRPTRWCSWRTVHPSPSRPS